MNIESHPLILGFPEKDRQRLLSAIKTTLFPQKTVLFEENQPSDSCLLVLEGEVILTKTLPDGKEQVISTSKTGEFFGEIGVITQSPRSLKATAQAQTTIAAIPAAIFLETIQGVNAGSIGKILQGIIQHLHLTTNHYINDVIQQEKMAVVGTMINGLLHDFKNPFSVINMSAQLIAGEHSDDLTQELCKNIEEQVEHMLTMGSEISEFSQGKTHLTLSTFNLRNLIARFLELNPILCKDSDIQLEVDVPPIEIEAEDIKILRVIQNLVFNAVDACKTDSNYDPQTKRIKKIGKINIKAIDQGTNVELSISDNGQGIPEAIQQKFFQPFVTHGKAKGTGLGAAIVKSIIESHGGTIRFETTSQIGTKFIINLPKKH